MLQGCPGRTGGPAATQARRRQECRGRLVSRIGEQIVSLPDLEVDVKELLNL